MNDINLITRCLTPQEHALQSKTQPNHYNDYPYKPLFIQDGQMTIEDCNRIRKLTETAVCHACYWGNPHILGKMTLEPLDNITGETESDPTLISVSGGKMRAEIDFPFMRDHPKTNLGDIKND